MSGLLASYNSQHAAAWNAMGEEIRVLGRDGFGEWHDAESAVSLARAQLFNTPEAKREEPILIRGDVAAAFDGRLVERGSRESRTDSEILLDAYARWDLQCVSRLRGDFAFVLWDRKRKRLFAACDVLGMRTLAYHASGEMLLLSSRAVTLLRHPQVPRAWDEVYLANTLCDLWSHSPGSTPFASVRRLRPGWGIVAEGGGSRLVRVDELAVQVQPARRREEEYYDEFRELFDASVRDRWRDGIPTCISLSGGLDSSCVAASLLPVPGGLDAFSMVISGDAGRVERELLGAFLGRYPQVRSRLVDCTDPQDEVPGPLMDDPMIPDAALDPARQRLDRAIVDEGFRIVYGGDGADELFEVWNRVGDLVSGHAVVGAARWLLSRGPLRTALLTEVLLPNLPESLRNRWMIRRTVRSKLSAPWMTPAFRATPAVREALREDARLEALWTLPSALPAFIESGGVTARIHSRRLCLASLGLEPASPFWDRRVIEFVLRVPATLRVHPMPKVFLRRAFESRLPPLNAAHSKEISWFLRARQRSLGAARARAVVRAVSRPEHPLARWVDARAAETALAGVVGERSWGVDSEIRTAQLDALVHLAGWTGLNSQPEFP